MHSEEPDFEQRLARFDSIVDRFTLTLHQWRQLPARAASSDSGDLQSRIETLEERVEHEARALRQLHEEPLKQLQAHTANLGELCIAATKSVNGLDQAESRLAAMEADLHLHLADLSKNFQALVTDLRTATSPPAPVPGPATSWPLDRVVHLHGELRRGMGHPDTSLPPAADVDQIGDASPVTLAADVAETPAPRGFRPAWWYAVIGLVVVAAASLVIVERRLDARLTDATTRVAAAEQHAAAATQMASRQIASARDEADRQVAAARHSAERVERIATILMAPDLVRFPLSGGSAEERLSGQALWSRTRGLVFNASQLPIAPPQATYQLWLWTNGQPVSAGALIPDASGAATLVTEGALKVPGPVTNFTVTLEPRGGATTPSGRTLLARLQ